MSKPNRGEIWIVSLDPIIGREQAKTRPCLVLSNNSFNSSKAELIIAIPLTSKKKNIPLHIPIYIPEGGLNQNSYLMCEQIRALSIERFSGKPLGKVNDGTLEQVELILKVLLDFV